MEEHHLLVQRGELDNVLATLIDKQQTVIADIEKCLPLIKDNELKEKTKIELKVFGCQWDLIGEKDPEDIAEESAKAIIKIIKEYRYYSNK